MGNIEELQIARRTLEFTEPEDHKEELCHKQIAENALSCCKTSVVGLLHQKDNISVTIRLGVKCGQAQCHLRHLKIRAGKTMAGKCLTCERAVKKFTLNQPQM